VRSQTLSPRADSRSSERVMGMEQRWPGVHNPDTQSSTGSSFRSYLSLSCDTRKRAEDKLVSDLGW